MLDRDDYAMPDGKPWGEPLWRLDVAWQRIESVLCAAVLVAEIASLTLWVMLRGLATDTIAGGNAGGLVCRALLMMTLLAVGAHLATRKLDAKVHAGTVAAAMVLGIVAGVAMKHVGTTWASNTLNWFQGASVLTLVGGLRGLATRFTLWVALLGASLASSRGKHIHVDVLLHYIPRALRAPAIILSLLTGILVCVSAAVGFTDYITIAVFQVNAERPCPGDATKQCDVPTGEKLGSLAKIASDDFFLLGRQASLDVRALPHIIAGTPFDGWLTGAEWNTWLDGADWTAHFPKAAVDAQRADPNQPAATRAPAVQVPGGGDARGLMARELDFVFPFGLIIIALKFVLQILLILAGYVKTDPDEEFVEEGLPGGEGGDADKVAA
jgi:TRAP-type C4-dicarboxylate transport system permease small subunit